MARVRYLNMEEIDFVSMEKKKEGRKNFNPQNSTLHWGNVNEYFMKLGMLIYKLFKLIITLSDTNTLSLVIQTTKAVTLMTVCAWLFFAIQFLVQHTYSHNEKVQSLMFKYLTANIYSRFCTQWKVSNMVFSASIQQYTINMAIRYYT